METESIEILKALGLIVGCGIGMQWLAWRLRIPAIVMLTFCGILIGPVFGLVHPHLVFKEFLGPVIEIAVVIILFEGGLQLRFHEIKSAGSGIFRLISLGIIFHFVLGALGAHYLAGLSWPVSFMISSILVVTGPTVIIPALRNACLTKDPASYLKWEGIINDPIGALLTVLIFDYLLYHGSASGFSVAFYSLFLAVAGSVLAAGFLGFFLARAFQRAWVPDYLKVPVVFVSILLAFILMNSFQNGAGLLTVTLLGIYLGNKALPISKELKNFKESISIFAVSAVFIVLSASLNPENLKLLRTKQFFYLAAVIFLIRPVAIFFATMGSKMHWRERVFVSWIGPRGIVAASLAGIVGPKLAHLGYTDARLILPLVFSVVMLTVICHGFTLNILARFLKLSGEKGKGLMIVGCSSWSKNLAGVLQSLSIPVLLVDSSWQKLKGARQMGTAVHHGEIIHDIEAGKVELSNFDCLLAATDNDAYNALVCTSLAGDFGRNRVFQLPFSDGDPEQNDALPPSLRGNLIMHKLAYFDQLVEKFYSGWRFKKTPLTQAFTYEDHLKNVSPEEALPLMVLRASGRIDFLFTDYPRTPENSDMVISFTKDKNAKI